MKRIFWSHFFSQCFPVRSFPTPVRMSVAYRLFSGGGDSSELNYQDLLGELFKSGKSLDQIKCLISN